jgi:hypothetical protein
VGQLSGLYHLLSLLPETHFKQVVVVLNKDIT